MAWATETAISGLTKRGEVVYVAVGDISGDTCPEPYHIAHAEIFCENLFSNPCASFADCAAALCLAGILR